MLDIKVIRENLDWSKKKLATRGIKPEELDKLVAIDKERREALTKSEQLKQKRNEVSDQIAQAKRNKEDASDAIKTMREVGKEIKDLDKEVEDLTQKQKYILLRLPNFPADSDPIGPDESYNEEVRKWNEPTKFDFEPKPHWEIGTELNILDWDTAAKVSGARFVYYKGKILDAKQLPINVTAFSPAFRSEAGSAGRDTRGLIRMHEFRKVEMVKIVDEDSSWDELEKLTHNAEHLLQKLGLPYHVVALSTGDASFTSAKTYDLEVWMPAQDKYREISSCSNCTDFQARRSLIRYRDENGKLHLAHTLNGSGLAVGRTVAAILENYQNEDGTVNVPEALQPYMHGMKVITKEPKFGE